MSALAGAGGRGGHGRPCGWMYDPLSLRALLAGPSLPGVGYLSLDAAADALARRDVALATGVNREAYQAAAVAAKRHGGAAVMALDRGLLTLFPAGPEREPVPAARVWDETLDPATQILLSPFALRDQWTPRSGPRRDALLFELAAAVVAVDVRPGGNMERECRRAVERGIPLFLAGEEAAAAGLEAILPAERRLKSPLSADEVAARIHAALPARAA